MSLLNCPECHAQVSDQAVTCPHCGFPLKAGSPGPRYQAPEDSKSVKTPEHPILRAGWMSIAVAGLILLIFLLLSTCKWAPV